MRTPIPLTARLCLAVLTLHLIAIGCYADPETPTQPPMTLIPTDSPTPPPSTPSATPTPTATPVCGDGRLGPDEACDDGAAVSGDGCSEGCRVEPFYICLGEPSVCAPDAAVCGDGLIYPDEACDDGNKEEGDGCSASCQVEPHHSCEGQPSRCSLDPALCGDGRVHPDEGCDDQNVIGGDGCSQLCEVEPFFSCEGQPSACELVPVDCGDGQKHPLEGCDDGEANSNEDPDACRTDCTLPSCGDGVVDEGESCDDGPANSDSEPDACRTICQPAGCGDGVTEGDELCDDGDENSNALPDACRTDCAPARCGDGVVDTPESCDKGMNNSDLIADACRTDCSAARCGDGVVDTSEACDDGAGNSDTAPGACRLDCEEATCGDGVVDPDEECDEGSGNINGVLGGCNTQCQVQLEYEKILTLSPTGVFITGDQATLDARLWEEAATCRARFDGRIHEVGHIEKTSEGYLLDFHGLHAWNQAEDSYAFIALEPGIRAGLGTSKRLARADTLLLKDRAQAEEVQFTAMTVDLYCARRNPYSLLGAFDAGGLATEGTFDAVFEAAVDRAADCKVRVDDRLFEIPHVEYDTYLLYLDVIGLGEARYPASDTYAQVEISSGVRAGMGVLPRRGNVNLVTKKDRDDEEIAAWLAAPVEVFCADRYAPTLTMLQGGSVLSGVGFIDLVNTLTVEGRRCKARFDNRVATPRFVEFEAGQLRLGLANQHAWNDGGDALAYVDLQADERAGLGAVYLRGLDGDVFKPAAEQWPSEGMAEVDLQVDVLCEQDQSWIRAYEMDEAGVDAFGLFSDFYTLVTDRAVECRLMTDGLIAEPVMLEYSPGNLLFDYHGLSAYARGNEAYATHVMTRQSHSSRGGSYRDGGVTEVGLRDRSQAPLSELVPTSVAAFCR